MLADMNRRSFVLILFVSLLAVPAALSARKLTEAKPDALLVWARLQENLQTASTPPFLMRADLEVSGRGGGKAKGGYVLAWASFSQWREEIKFKGYDRVRVGTTNGYWQSSNLDYRPEFVNQVEELLDIRRVTQISIGETLSTIRVRKEHGITEACTEAQVPDEQKQTLCFNVANGTLLSVENPILGVSRIDYSGFNSVDGKLVPYEIRASQGGQTIAEVKITEIEKLPQNISAAFTAPPHAEFWETCDHMRGAKVLVQPKPLYPSGARGAGVAIFYAVIEPDGRLSHVKPVEISGPLFVEPALSAFKNWRFRPATCGGKPIRVPTTIVTNYVR